MEWNDPLTDVFLCFPFQRMSSKCICHLANDSYILYHMTHNFIAGGQSSHDLVIIVLLPLVNPCNTYHTMIAELGGCYMYYYNSTDACSKCWCYPRCRRTCMFMNFNKRKGALLTAFLKFRCNYGNHLLKFWYGKEN